MGEKPPAPPADTDVQEQQLLADNGLSNADYNVLVAITAAGLAALEAAVPRHTEHVRRLVLDRLTPPQIDQLADMSRTILDGLHAP